MIGGLPSRWLPGQPRRASCTTLALSLLLVLPALAETAPQGMADKCALEGGEDRTVARVIDGETLVLDGGSEVRLIGALAPRSFDAAAGESGDWAPADRARDGLERIVAGRNVRIAFAGRRTDRYGRLLAHVFAGADGAHVWVQGEMLKQGLARAYALEGSTQCLAELVAHEALAREKAVGLWGEAAYAVRGADGIAGLLRLAGTFQIVEGRVHGVSEVRGTVYINFGEDFRQDFTVMIRQQARRGMPEAGLVPQELAGRRIRVRGWIERRGGPMIEVSHASAIEVLAPEAAEAAAAAKAPPARRRSRARAEPAR